MFSIIPFAFCDILFIKNHIKKLGLADIGETPFIYFLNKYGDRISNEINSFETITGLEYCSPVLDNIQPKKITIRKKIHKYGIEISWEIREAFLSNELYLDNNENWCYQQILEDEKVVPTIDEALDLFISKYKDNIKAYL
jgi:hypothetical protein